MLEDRWQINTFIPLIIPLIIVLVVHMKMNQSLQIKLSLAITLFRLFCVGPPFLIITSIWHVTQNPVDLSSFRYVNVR